MRRTASWSGPSRLAAAVFAAWSDRDTKAKWFAVEDGRYSLDFRVGGTEAVHGGDGVDLVARSEYQTSS